MLPENRRSIGDLYWQQNQDRRMANLVFLFMPWVVASSILQAKRLHDLGRSGWIQLWGFIPLINFVYIVWALFVLGGVSGTPGSNKYGENPLAIKRLIQSWQAIMIARNRVEYDRAHYLFVENKNTQDPEAWLTFLLQAKEEFTANEATAVALRNKADLEIAEQQRDAQRVKDAKVASDKVDAAQLKASLKKTK